MDYKTYLRSSLTSTPKFLPGWYRYDKKGSELNDQILDENEHYYFHRSELAILKANISELLVAESDSNILVDMGSGNCIKTKLVIDELLKSRPKLKFFPVDISEEFLSAICTQLKKEYLQKLEIHPLPGDYKTGINQLKKVANKKIILWFGSIQSLDYDDQIAHLRQLADLMDGNETLGEKHGSCLIFTLDITQDSEDVLKAYNDTIGRRFFWNSIERLNRDEKSHLTPDDFKMEVDFVCDKSLSSASYLRVLLRAKRSMLCSVAGLGINIEFSKGEPLYLHEGAGISHKYTIEQIQYIVKQSGLELTEKWVDEKGHVAMCKCKQASCFPRLRE